MSVYIILLILLFIFFFIFCAFIFYKENIEYKCEHCFYIYKIKSGAFGNPPPEVQNQGFCSESCKAASLKKPKKKPTIKKKELSKIID